MTDIKTSILIVFAFLLTACNPVNDNTIRIATAANMQYAMYELSKVFTEQYDINCELIVSSSGKLIAQIKEGAPYDVFVSADMKYPNDLYASSLTKKAPKVYAYGKVVLWTLIEDINPSIAVLTDTLVTNIALANPKIAPYGAAALSILKYHNVSQVLNEKLVYGESVSQVNQFITSKAAEIGFTSKSVVLTDHLKNVGNWVDIDQQFYDPIKQGVVVLNGLNEQQDNNAQLFYDFLFSEEAKEILKKFGYSVDE